MLMNFVEGDVKRGLKYGVIYIYGAGEEMQSHLKDIFDPDVKIEVINSPSPEQPRIVARKFNVGNLGRDETIEAKLTGNIADDVPIIRKFKDEWLRFANFDTGSTVIEAPVVEEVKSLKQSSQKIFSRSRPKVFQQRLEEDIAQIIKQQENRIDDTPNPTSNDDLGLDEVERDYYETVDSPLSSPKPRIVQHKFQQAATDFSREDNFEEFGVEREEYNKQRLLKLIEAATLYYMFKYNEDPLKHLEETIQKRLPVNLSRLMVNGNFDIFFPDIDDERLNLYPLSKTIYLFFLLHPEGVKLSHLRKEENVKELVNIYSIVMPNRDEELARAGIERILDRQNGTLYQHLSRIKRLIKAKIINDNLASQYYISGTHGEVYRIPFVAEHRDMLSLPRILTM